jgi:hypothetical protein
LQKGNIVDTNWKKVPVEPTDEMIEAGAEYGYGHSREKAKEWAKEDKFDSQCWQAKEYYEAMLAAAPEYKPRHSLEEDFQHFLAYQGWLGLSDEEIARLRIDYEHGASRGE